MEEAIKKKKIAMPDTLIIVAAIVLLTAILTWIIPSGTYDYKEVNINGTVRNVAIDGTYHVIDKADVVTTGFLGFFGALYRGCVNAADIIFVILCCCGTFGILVKTGAFHAGIGTVLKKLGGKEILLVPIIMMIFGLGGSVFGMASEFYGFYPLIVGLGVALGYDAMFGFAVIAVGEFVGFMGATLNPYSVGVAQTISGVPLYSGTSYRAICFLVFMAISIIYVMRYGAKIKKHPELSVVYGEDSIHAFERKELDSFTFTKKDALVLLDVVVILVVLMYGLMKRGWGYPELCGLFLIMSMVAAGICRWSPNKWCNEFIDSAKTVLWGCILTGVAKAIVVVMTDAQILDTVIFNLSNLLKHAPEALSAQFMLIVQTLINFFIPSATGQAAATMPIMSQLADIIGVSRQTAVLAFQFGDGLSNIFWPTADIVIICGLGGISLQKWYKWFTPLFLTLLVTQMILLGIAVAIGY
ncbi:YfcC family protein [Hornefia butyriciproducens]|uniref:YfcC family protein n=1 Tax=Hornefia butyriciproducens TaxID=2652293 RepID=UPI002A90B70B|nr:YfcC family protein [Hornefia butyriciproducens]MCI7412560.1 TIGR00366 family protein [Clostridiales bacterium]MDY6211898.1 YfcC family protein [Hornefia butyriciproducens]